MSASASLLDLPVEILHHLFDFLDLSTISFSLPNVCRILRDVLRNYLRHHFDFTSISKRHFDRLCHRIEPTNVYSLTLSDDYRTPGEIRSFFSIFDLHQFDRLTSLSLFNIDDDDLNEILRKSFPSRLISLIIVWRRSHSPNENTLFHLSSILSQLKLHRLELLSDSYAFETMLWPIQNTVEHLSLIYITHRQLSFLFRQFPKLKTLKLNDCSMHLVDEELLFARCSTSNSLKSLTMIECRLSLNQLGSIFRSTRNLTDLKIIGSADPFDSIADAFQWENLLRSNLIFLSKFEFFFTNIYNVYYRSNDLDALIDRFRTSFWIDEKRCFVIGDLIESLHQVMIYTNPLCSKHFSFESETKRISRSNATIFFDEKTKFHRVRTLTTTLNKLKLIKTNEILFRNLTKLTIDVDDDWSIDLVENLSTFVDLSRLEKIRFNPDLNRRSLTKTIESIRFLFERSTSFHSLSIQPYFSSTDENDFFSLNSICSLIPQHVKHLEISVKNIETMLMIIDAHRHLSSVAFYWSNDESLIEWSDFLSFLNDEMKFKYWFSVYSFHLWLN